jgi:short-subunit dehydrogenase
VFEKRVKAAVFTSNLSLPNAGEQLYNAITQAGLSVNLLISNAGYGRLNFTEALRYEYKTRNIQIMVLRPSGAT